MIRRHLLTAFGVAAALAPVWERIRKVAQPNPLAG